MSAVNPNWCHQYPVTFYRGMEAVAIKKILANDPRQAEQMAQIIMQQDVRNKCGVKYDTTGVGDPIDAGGITI